MLDNWIVERWRSILNLAAKKPNFYLFLPPQLLNLIQKRVLKSAVKRKAAHF
jgi:hypothetical protein